MNEAFVLAAKIAGESNCAKQGVGAVISRGGEILGIGNNDCQSPKESCPRDRWGYRSGEGYDLCYTQCHQPGHAEIAALVQAATCFPKKEIRGATCYVYGHTYSCTKCLETLADYGIVDVRCMT